MNDMEGVQIGRIVHYVDPVKKDTAAIIVGVYEADRCNLVVFYDCNYASIRVTDIPYSEKPKPRTWHWPERV